MLGRLLRLSYLVAASVLLAFAYNVFFLPHDLLSAGATGLAMIVGHLFELNTGLLIFALNVPVFVLGLVKLGRSFVGLSILSVALTSLSMQWIPVVSPTADPILAAVFGGVVAGIAIGLILRAGGSTGGFDILGVVLTQRREFPLGELLFFMNGLVVAAAGFVFGWEPALYTLLTMFAMGKAIDVIHTRHVKLTLWIVTRQGEALKRRLISEFYRGVTVLDAHGAYSREPRELLVTVVTRVEFEAVKRAIRETDPQAFVNVTGTLEVMGSFHRDSAAQSVIKVRSPEPAEAPPAVLDPSAAPIPQAAPASPSSQGAAQPEQTDTPLAPAA